MNAVWMLRVLRWAYVAFISAASGMAVVHGRGEGKHGASVVLALAIPELIAALAFLVEPIEVAACVVLLVVFAAAGILSLESGDFLAPLRFCYFAATAFYIVQARRNLPVQMQTLAVSE